MEDFLEDELLKEIDKIIDDFTFNGKVLYARVRGSQAHRYLEQEISDVIDKYNKLDTYHYFSLTFQIHHNVYTCGEDYIVFCIHDLSYGFQTTLIKTIAVFDNLYYDEENKTVHEG